MSCHEIETRRPVLVPIRGCCRPLPETLGLSTDVRITLRRLRIGAALWRQPNNPTTEYLSGPPVLHHADVTADCDADADVFGGSHDKNGGHNYTRTPSQAVAAILHAGTDLDCGGFVEEHALAALLSKAISPADIAARLQKLFRVRLRLGHFDPPGPLQKIGTDQICTEDTLALARSGATQGAVLLKNTAQRLPLSAVAGGTAGAGTVAKGSVTAVIGPNANLSRSIAGYYGGKQPCGGHFWSMLDAVQQQLATAGAGSAAMQYEPGVASTTSNDTSLFSAAVAAARTADDVILVVGQDGKIEKENRDRASVSLTPTQSLLVQQVAAAAKHPVVVVILSGGAIDVAEVRSPSPLPPFR
jgi:beta-D-xylosidase 4